MRRDSHAGKSSSSSARALICSRSQLITRCHLVRFEWMVFFCTPSLSSLEVTNTAKSFCAPTAAVREDSAAAPPPAASQGDARGGSSGSSHSAEQPKPAECRDAVGRRRAALSQDLARLGRRGPPAALARPLPTRSAESTKRSTSAVGGRRVWSQLTSPPSRGSPCSSCQRRLKERLRARCAPHRAVGRL